jgi:hypothetical protein
MGFFGTFVYSSGTWGEAATSDEYLGIDVHTAASRRSTTARLAQVTGGST